MNVKNRFVYIRISGKSDHGVVHLTHCTTLGGGSQTFPPSLSTFQVLSGTAMQAKKQTFLRNSNSTGIDNNPKR